MCSNNEHCYIMNTGNFDSTRPALNLVEKWSSRLPHGVLDKCDVWDDVISNRFERTLTAKFEFRRLLFVIFLLVDWMTRLLYVSNIIGKLSSNQITDVNSLHSHVVGFQLQYARAACDQTNHLVALKQLKYSRDVSCFLIGCLFYALYNVWPIIEHFS